MQYIDADDEKNRLTYGGVQSLFRKIGHGLRELGLRPGDVVLGFSPNSILYPCAIYGVICAGGIFTGANPTYTSAELVHQLTHSGAKYLLVDAQLVPVAREACRKCGFDERNVLTVTPVKGFRSLASLTTSGKELSWERITDRKVLESRTCIILYSSGTTGLPKGVELTHANIVANTAQSQWVREQGDAILVKKGGEPLKGPYIGHLPMYHAYGLMQACNSALRTGTCFIITRKFDLLQMLDLIQRYKVQQLSTVPPVVTLLAKHPIVDKYDLSSLRSVGSGAAPLSKEVQDALRKRARNASCQQGWGMSEATCTGTSFTQADDDTEGSIGRLVPGTIAKLVDDDGKEVTTPGGRGELCIKGPQVMKGYLNNPTATKETIIDGWLHSGDIAVQSEDGRRFWIVDRKKELIKANGLQVAPAELEALLLSSDLVADAAVIGIPDEKAGELPYAYIVLAENVEASGTTKDSIMKFMEERTAKFKRIKDVEFVSVIPKSPSGKILRKDLRVLYKSKTKL